MGTFFTRDRFRTPQLIAACLLLIFVAQCAWLVARQHAAIVSAEELARVQEGWAQWHGHGVAGTPTALVAPDESLRMRGSPYDPDHSPLGYLIESAPIVVFNVAPESTAWLWLTRVPYIGIGALLGASLWYVSRRLYGNTGGYTALTLYCFSPAVIRTSTLWFAPPDIAAAWGTFGAVFTAVAVSHTLYAPREVVVWNWRRIVLLGISLALAVGTSFSLVLIVPLLLVFMLYLAPHRVAAVMTILLSACSVGLVLLFASYFFHLTLFMHGLGSAVLFRGIWPALRLPAAYSQIVREIVDSGPVLALLVPVCVAVWAVTRRSRYFGNTAPLLCALLFIILRVFSPHDAGSVYGLLASVFLFVFVGGIVADVLGTRAREFGIAILGGMLAANAFWNLLGLVRISG